MGGLSAAFGITESPDWQDHFDVTVYQLGWRLGGKGASGRNASKMQRIEEHGLHVWGGFYENAFRVIRAAYAELGRPPTAPLATWDAAFKPNVMVSWMEDLDPWLAWNNRFPQYESTPGDGTPMPSLWEGVLRVIEWIIQTYFDDGADGDPSATETQDPLPESVLQALALPVDPAFAERRSGLSADVHEWIETAEHQGEHELLLAAYKLMSRVGLASSEDTGEVHHALVGLLDKLQVIRESRASSVEQSPNLRRTEILINLGIAEVKGIVSDGVLLHGFDVINGMDLAAWFTKHGASQAAVESGVVRGAYDFIFAYEDGDPAKPLLEAGTGLRMIFRLIMWYKGAIFWKMQAGMGDTVFTPLYQVLKERGVIFKFFQEAQSLTLSEDKKSVATIEIGEQATVTSGEYQPLVSVKDLECWPSEPLYDQLAQGDELKREGIDLESPWAPWNPVASYELEVGTDFDIVVLATSLAPIADYARSLVDESLAWQKMMGDVKTVQTQAFQLWMNADLEALGWTAGPTVLTGYAHPYETWADMSQVIPREEWPSGEGPSSIAYFCGAMPATGPIPPFSDHGFPAKQTALAKQDALEWVSSNILGIWPLSHDTNGEFDWSLVDDPGGGVGQSRFDSQYWRANVAPAERYVLSVPSSTASKLTAGQTGFENVFLAGDWVRNGLDFGCIESATMGGLQASQAICGYPKEIVGEHDGV